MTKDTVYSSLGYHAGGMVLCAGIHEGKIFC